MAPLQVFSKLGEHLGDRGVGLASAERKVVPKPESVNKWGQRWRRKWKAAIGRVHTQLGGDRASVSDKVARKLCDLRR